MRTRLAPRFFSTTTKPEDILRIASSAPASNVRNFSIVAHIDAGKSTLSDRLLECAGNLTSKDTRGGQVLDKLRVERERGITVKAQCATMIWKDEFVLNLIDTPGHVDFTWEVRRSLFACQGALLLIDSTQGVQAQTLANFRLAVDAGLVIVPCLTKLDLRTSDPEGSLRQMESLLGVKESDVIWTSAKTGEGVADVLDAVVKRVPQPDVDVSESQGFAASVIDLWHDQYRGVVVLFLVHRGAIRSGERVTVLGSGAASGESADDSSFEVKEIGIFQPDPVPSNLPLGPGRVGYMLSVNSKGAKGAFIGAIIVSEKEAKVLQIAKRASIITNEHVILPLSGRMTTAGPPAKPKPTVFASCYPLDAEDFDELRKAVSRLALNDSSVTYKLESSTALGQGFRCGFLGALHMEVFIQRLEDEFGARLISTAPNVSYTCELTDGTTIVADSPSQLPDPTKVRRTLEPMVRVTLFTPIEYVSPIMAALQERRGIQETVEMLDTAGTKYKLVFRVPWQEAVTDLHDTVKGCSSGYASLDLSECEAEAADIVRVDLLLNGEKAEPLAFVCHRSQAERRGRQVAKRLKEVIPPQQFEVIIQAAVGQKIVARERMRGMRKNVLEKNGKTMGGGDVTRKNKLLDQQKRGKEKLKSVGSVQLNQESFRAVLDSKRGDDD